MKFCIFFVFVFSIKTFASDVLSQKTEEVIAFELTSLIQVLDEIETHTNYRFLYQDNTVKDINVTLDTKNKTWMEILDQIHEFSDIDYEVFADNLIVLKPTSYLQPSTIIGTVTDGTGESLPGVSILIKGTTRGSVTNLEGEYTLLVDDPTSTLAFSYVGYLTQEILVGAQTRIDVILEPDVTALEEVVVVGFGTQRKVNLTGAVSTVNSETLDSRPVTNVGQALQGIVPGLNITNSGQLSGSLENRPAINIRGIATIGEGSSGEPLILIDGMEGDINAINPQDIDNISVLKDAAASSIYGSRAPFGVILVTTKKGKVGKPVVTFSTNYRSNRPLYMPTVVDSYTWALMMNETQGNSGGGVLVSAENLQWIKDVRDGVVDYASNTLRPRASDPLNWSASGADWGSANTDWHREVFKSAAPSQEYLLSVGGGAENLTYYLSASSLSQDGLLKLGHDSYDRKNISAKFTVKATDWASIGYSGRYSKEQYERPSWLGGDFPYTWGAISSLNRGPSAVLKPLKDPNGFWFTNNDYESPVMFEVGGDYNSETTNTSHQFNITLEPVKGWKIFADFNFNIIDRFQHDDRIPVYNHNVLGEPFLNPVDTYVHEQSSRRFFSNNNVYSEYSRTFGDHNIKVMAGFQSELSEYRDLSAKRSGVMSPSQTVLNLTSGVDISGNVLAPVVSGLYTDWTTAGFFGRINYNYQERYLLEGNLRYDGSSRWRADERWNFFPSVSAGWNVANENFFSPLQAYVNILKIRGSYGELGNQNTWNNYPTYVTQPTQTSRGTWLIDNMRPNTAWAPALVSSSLTWETIRTYNIGADLGLFANQLTASFDYYKRFTNDMIGPPPTLPAVLGTAVPPSNNTDLETWGFEFNVNWRDRLENGLGYGIQFLLSDSRTKVTRYPNETMTLWGYRHLKERENYNYLQGYFTGEIWGYTTIGIAQSDQEMNDHLASLPNGGQSGIGSNWQAGDIMFKDINGDGKIDNGSATADDPGDLSIIGNKTPRYTFGVDINADWKGFDVRAFFQGIMKRDWWAGQFYGPFWGAGYIYQWSNFFEPHMDCWRPESSPLGANLDSYYPRPRFRWENNKQVQTRYLQNAAYIRLKNLQVGYTIPESITQRIAIQRLRVYVSGENLWTYTKISELFDPETIDGGYGGVVYPLSKVYSAGLTITF